ncbi:EF-hand domain-containing protein [archaeon]|nr:MAG: EF-hand domain-containing protein [archaeon]
MVVIPMTGYIIETCSMLKAISELNLDVVHEVLHEDEDTKLLMDDLRAKMLRRIKTFENMHQDKVQIIHALFDEIDQDGSGEIDKVEFRYLLRMLKLTYSNERFNRLFRAVDTSGQNILFRI